MTRKILQNCRAIYRAGIFLLKVGLAAILAGLVIDVLGKGWTILVLGLGWVLGGIILGQLAEAVLVNKMKSLVARVTAREAHEVAVRYLQGTGGRADETELFLNKFVEEMERRRRQKKAE